jgi:hypothetical protein
LTCAAIERAFSRPLSDVEMRQPHDEEFAEYIEGICRRPAMYTPTGTFYECAAFIEGVTVNHRNSPFKGASSHNPYLGFIKWALAKWEVNPKGFIGWRLFREHYSTDEEALESFPKMFREFLKNA